MQDLTKNEFMIYDFLEQTDIGIYSIYGMPSYVGETYRIDNSDIDKESEKRLIEIGMATDEAFHYYSMGAPDEDGNCLSFDMIGVEDLLKWYRKR